MAHDRVAALVSATNGKTSTTRLLAAAVEQAGPVISQNTGANMTSGVAVTLASGDPAAQAVLEVDEAYLPAIFQGHETARHHPGESEPRPTRPDERGRHDRPPLADMLADATDTTVVANADDPRSSGQPDMPSCDLGSGRSGVDRRLGGVPGLRLLAAAGDSTWGCPNCGFARPTPTWTLEWVDDHGVVHGPHDQRFDLP